tara:strand:- start:211 stop:534 length:324 start_codon:yes stop_codon:yes gene_type:complete
MTDFLNLQKASRGRMASTKSGYSKEANPLRRSISGLTPGGVLTIKPRVHMTRKELEDMRTQIYTMAKEIGVKVETVIQPNIPQMIMIRLNQNWPVSKAPVTVGSITS